MEICVNPWVAKNHGISITSDIKIGHPISGTWFNIPEGSYNNFDWIGVLPSDVDLQDPWDTTLVERAQKKVLWWTYFNGNGAQSGNFTTSWLVPKTGSFRLHLFDSGFTALASTQAFSAG